MRANDLKLVADKINGRTQEMALTLDKMDLKEIVKSEVEMLICSRFVPKSEEGKYEYYLPIKEELFDLYKKEFKKRGFEIETREIFGMKIYIPCKISWGDKNEDDDSIDFI